jgi:ornithine--oxo-acid transaminase
VLPDGLVLGKALGGGLLPVSAFLAREDVMAQFTPGDHGSTFGGNPLAAAVGLAALELLEREQLARRAQEQGEYLMAQLWKLQHPAITEIRGRGLLVGVQIAPAFASAREVCERLMDEGVLTKDTHHTVVRLAPPLVIERAQVDEAVEALRRALRTLGAKAGVRCEVTA